MKLNLSFVVVLLFLLSVIIVHCADPDPNPDPDPQVKKNTHDNLDTTTRAKVVPKVGLNEKTTTTTTVEVGLLKKEKDGNDVKNGDVEKIKSVVTKQQLGEKEGGGVKDLVGSVEKKIKTEEVSGGKDVVGEGSVTLLRKGSLQCDSAFKCTIGDGESGGMVACLSVPGDESTDVSLLIQNKGKGLLDVDITAPDFVHLDKTKVQIQENDDEKVTVSIGNGKTGNLITLKTLQGSCNLDFMDFLTHNPMKKSNYMSQLTYTNLFRRTPFLGLLSLALILVTLSVVVCVAYQKRRYVNNGGKFQKLDAGLPVSGGPKIDFDQKDGWDDSWGDDWDDVEAPSTPSMPLTPSISSAGVSSRRVNKDAWKD